METYTHFETVIIYGAIAFMPIMFVLITYHDKLNYNKSMFSILALATAITFFTPLLEGAADKEFINTIAFTWIMCPMMAMIMVRAIYQRYVVERKPIKGNAPAIFYVVFWICQFVPFITMAVGLYDLWVKGYNPIALSVIFVVGLIQLLITSSFRGLRNAHMHGYMMQFK